MLIDNSCMHRWMSLSCHSWSSGSNETLSCACVGSKGHRSQQAGGSFPLDLNNVGNLQGGKGQERRHAGWSSIRDRERERDSTPQHIRSDQILSQTNRSEAAHNRENTGRTLRTSFKHVQLDVAQLQPHRDEKHMTVTNLKHMLQTEKIHVLKF